MKNRRFLGLAKDKRVTFNKIALNISNWVNKTTKMVKATMIIELMHVNNDNEDEIQKRLRAQQ